MSSCLKKHFNAKYIQVFCLLTGCLKFVNNYKSEEYAMISCHILSFG